MNKKQLKRQIERTKRFICEPLKEMEQCGNCKHCGIMMEIAKMEKELEGMK